MAEHPIKISARKYKEGYSEEKHPSTCDMTGICITSTNFEFKHAIRSKFNVPGDVNIELYRELAGTELTGNTVEEMGIAPGEELFALFKRGATPKAPHPQEQCKTAEDAIECPIKITARKYKEGYSEEKRPSTCAIIGLCITSTIVEVKQAIRSKFNVPGDVNIELYRELAGSELTGNTVEEMGIAPGEELFALFNTKMVGSSKIFTTTQSGRKIREQVGVASLPPEEKSTIQDKPLEKKGPTTKASEKKKRAAGDSGGVQQGKYNTQKKKARPTVKGANPKGPTKKKSIIHIEGCGFRLRDGKKYEGDRPTSRKGDQYESGTMGLIQALTEGKGALAKLTKLARLERDAEAKALARYASATASGSYVFTQIKGGTEIDGGKVLGTVSDFDEAINLSQLGDIRRSWGGDGCGDGADDCDDCDCAPLKMSVKFYNPIERRAHFQDDIVVWPEAKLISTLTEVYHASFSMKSHNDARLRPLLLAELLPEAFWSMVYHDDGKNETTEQMLSGLLPELEWFHLLRGGRKRGLSEKALDNLRQTGGANPTKTGTHANELVITQNLRDNFMALIGVSYEAIDAMAEHVKSKQGGRESEDDLHYHLLTHAFKILQHLLFPHDVEEKTDEKEEEEQEEQEEGEDQEEGEEGEEQEEQEEGEEEEDPLEEGLEYEQGVLDDLSQSDLLESNHYGGLLIMSGIRCSVITSFLGSEYIDDDGYENSSHACPCFHKAFDVCLHVGDAPSVAIATTALILLAREVMMQPIDGKHKFCNARYCPKDCERCTKQKHKNKLFCIYMGQADKSIFDLIAYTKKIKTEERDKFDTVLAHLGMFHKGVVKISKDYILSDNSE